MQFKCNTSAKSVTHALFTKIYKVSPKKPGEPSWFLKIIQGILEPIKDHLKSSKDYQTLPKITGRLQKIFKDYQRSSEYFQRLAKIAEDQLKTSKDFQSSPKNTQRFSKITRSFQRLSKISKEHPFKDFQRLLKIAKII